MYDYLIVGSGLYGSIFAREVTNKGYKCLVIDKRHNTGGNIYTENIVGINVHKYGVHIFHTNNKKCGTISLNLQSLTVLQSLLLQTIRENYILCLSICIPLTKCGA